MWRLAEGAETCRVLALWALQMKHTRFSRKKNASTAAAGILGLPATKGLGFIGDGRSGNISLGLNPLLPRLLVRENPLSAIA